MPSIRAGHQPRKRFGQNFLRDDAVIEAIARAVAAEADDHLVEIGPGEGALTAALITSGCRYDAIELDRDLTARLLAAFSIHPRFTLHSADALSFEFSALQENNTPLRIVGNLPYNISTPLIIRLLGQLESFADMHFMLQKEVVDRLAATPGNKHWGRLAILAQADCTVTHLFDVPPDAFFPPPKVQSAIVRLAPKPMPERLDCDREQLKRVVQTAFGQRRKTLRNNLKGHFDDAQLEHLGIDPGARAETLDLTAFARLADALERP